MDWLSPYHVALDCNAKTVTLAMPGVSRLSGRVLVVLILPRSSLLSVLRDWWRGGVCLT